MRCNDKDARRSSGEAKIKILHEMSEHPITAEICAKPKNRDKPGHVRHTLPRPDHREGLRGVPFQADQHPWQHGISKSTNGLPREYFPKDEPLGYVSEKRMSKQRMGSTEANMRLAAQKHCI